MKIRDNCTGLQKEAVHVHVHIVDRQTCFFKDYFLLYLRNRKFFLTSVDNINGQYFISISQRETGACNSKWGLFLNLPQFLHVFALKVELISLARTLTYLRLSVLSMLPANAKVSVSAQEMLTSGECFFLFNEII